MTTISSHPLVQEYLSNQEKNQQKFLKVIRSPFLFRLFLVQKLPMGFIAGLRVTELSADKCAVTVPYRWLNQNPFQSTYFAVLAMAAEMSSGMLAFMATFESKPSVSMLVTRVEADFVKKATGLTTFTCEDGAGIRETAIRAVETGESLTFVSESLGRNAAGEVEARFRVTWSMKMRRSRG
jgi:hypothetical protein